MDDIQITVGDITKLTVDAIVNSANQSLLPGSGLSGAIFRAAGDGMKEECAPFAPLETGRAIITAGYGLPAPHVIHTVAPKWYLNHPQRAEQLANCYRESLLVAEQHELRSIAFPCIGMGIYRCPLESGAKIAVATVYECLKDLTFCRNILFVCANEEQAVYYINLCEKEGAITG